MRKFKSSVLAVIGLLCSISVSAEDFEVDGIYYNIMSSTDMTVEVTYRGNFASDFHEYSGAITIPESVTYNGKTYSVTGIGESAFSYHYYDLTSVEIPNSVTYIGRNAFSECSCLTSLVVAVDNPVLDSRDGCNAIIHTESNTLIAGCQSSIIPNSVTSIGDFAFAGCYYLAYIVIPNSVTSIGVCAFEGCTLTHLVIPNSVTSIGGSAFHASALLSVEIPNSVTNIEPFTFSHCEYLQSVVIPNSVTSIGGYAFDECSSLTSIEIPNSVTSIEDYAFKGCTSLTSIVIPNSVTSIGEYAFAGCESLKTVLNSSDFTFTKGSEDFGAIAYYANLVVNKYDGRVGDFIFTKVNDKYYLHLYTGQDRELVLPTRYNESDYAIGTLAFQGCSRLTSVVIPNSVTCIGDSAFNGCSSLTSIVIPNSVTSIGGDVFTDTSLRTIVSRSDNPATLDVEGLGVSTIFSNYTYIHAPLYVPEGAYWNYAYAEGWGDFIHIKEMAMTEGALLSNKAYMIADNKGTNFKVYDAERDALKNVEYTHALDEESEDCCWTVMKENGKTYLYNLGAKKFGVVGDNGAISLSETPVHVAISETEGGLSINGNNCMFVLNKHVEVDATGISDVLLNGLDAKNAQIHSLDGRRQQTLKRGVNIVNGKKVFVQ